MMQGTNNATQPLAQQQNLQFTMQDGIMKANIMPGNTAGNAASLNNNMPASFNQQSLMNNNIVQLSNQAANHVMQVNTFNQRAHSHMGGSDDRSMGSSGGGRMSNFVQGRAASVDGHENTSQVISQGSGGVNNSQMIMNGTNSNFVSANSAVVQGTLPNQRNSGV